MPSTNGIVYVWTQLRCAKAFMNINTVENINAGYGSLLYNDNKQNIDPKNATIWLGFDCVSRSGINEPIKHSANINDILSGSDVNTDFPLVIISEYTAVVDVDAAKPYFKCSLKFILCG